MFTRPLDLEGVARGIAARPRVVSSHAVPVDWLHWFLQPGIPGLVLAVTNSTICRNELGSQPCILTLPVELFSCRWRNDISPRPWNSRLN